jgi:prepilin-type processing-associated H-X9-DG protein
MYRVLGIDQKEYGPVSAEVVRRWIREGRANARTRVRAEGAPDWKALAELPEFADALAAGNRSPPVIGRPGTGRPGTVRPTVPRAPRPETSGLAVGAMVCGLLSLCTGLPALVGLPLGLAALKQIKRSDGRLAGKGLAVTGLCASAFALLVLAVAIPAILLPEMAKSRHRAQQIACMNNLRQLGMAMRMYANDQSDRFALATNWCNALQDYAGQPPPFTCPAASARQSAHFGYNTRLSGLESVRIHPKTVLFFEIDGGWNVNGGAERVLRKPRHGGINICYADGSVEQVYPSRLSQLRWEP